MCRRFRNNCKWKFTVGSRAPPSGHRAYSLSDCVQQALPRKEYPIRMLLRGPLQKQPGVVCGLIPLFSRFLGCLHPLALKKGLLTLNKHTQWVKVQKHKQSPTSNRPFEMAVKLMFRGVTTFTVIQCFLYLCISSRCLLLNWFVHLGFN